MVLLVCPQDIKDTFPDSAVPFGPALATLAGLPAAGQYWHANWTCGPPLAFGKLSLSGFPTNNAPLLASDVDLLGGRKKIRRAPRGWRALCFGSHHRGIVPGVCTALNWLRNC